MQVQIRDFPARCTAQRFQERITRRACLLGKAVECALHLARFRARLRQFQPLANRRNGSAGNRRRANDAHDGGRYRAAHLLKVATALLRALVRLLLRLCQTKRGLLGPAFGGGGLRGALRRAVLRLRQLFGSAGGLHLRLRQPGNRLACGARLRGHLPVARIGRFA